MPQADSESYDVLIVGGGPYGFLTALLLERAGAKCLLLESAPASLASVDCGLQVLWPSPNDPPTRAVVAHGEEVARALNHFCAEGVRLFAEEFSLPAAQKLTTHRVSLHDFETSELALAVRLGLDLSTTSQSRWFKENEPAYACTGLRQLLLQNAVNFKQETVVKIEEKTDGVQVNTASGACFFSEIAVLATSHQIGALLPEFLEILVPMSDVCTTYEFEFPCATPGVLRGATGHFAMRWNETEKNADEKNEGQNSASTTLKVTGPRFLLPSAGVGVTWNHSDLTPEFQKKLVGVQRSSLLPLMAQSIQNIQASAKEAFNPTKESSAPEQFNLLKERRAPTSTVFVDCLPCDELPILGELGRHGRILGSAGWLGVGLSSGMAAATVTRDLILQGKSSLLHPRFEPRRLRTA